MSTRKRPAQRASSNRRLAYLRVSDGRQSYERQTLALMRDGRKHGFVVAEADQFVDDGISASIYSDGKIRGDFAALVELIESGAVDGATLWLAEVSRMIRNMEEYGPLRKLCREHGIKWFVTENGRTYDFDVAEDRQAINDMANKAEAETDKMSKRISDSVHVTIYNRRPHGRVPYGYQRIYDPLSGDFLEQRMHPEHGPIVAEIARRYADGEGTAAIARDLNARGITPAHNASAGGRQAKLGIIPGQQWDPAEICRRATMPVYLGIRRYNGKQAELVDDHDMLARPDENGGWPALIDLETHNACVERRANALLQRTPDSARHWLTGIAKCVNEGDGREHYICSRFKNGRDVYQCRRGCLQLVEEAVDAHVLAKLGETLSNDEWLHITSTDSSAALEAARVRLRSAEAEKATLVAARDQGQVTMADAIKLMAGAERDIESAQGEIRSLTVVGPLRTLAATPTSERWRVFLAFEFNMRRAATRELVTITLYPNGRGRYVRPVAEAITVTPR